MIIFLITCGLIILLTILSIIYNRVDLRISDALIIPLSALLITIYLVFVVEVIVMISVNIAVPLQIEKANMTYNSLCVRLDNINSDYENVSESDVIVDIVEWNKGVVHARYYANNPWTNWFWCKKLVDSYKTIDYESKLNGEISNE